MTREQAAQIIADALKYPNEIATNAALDLASHIATALDATGLLALAEGNTSEQLQRSRDANATLRADDLAKGRTTATEAHQAWASRRNREPDYPPDHPAPGDFGTIPP